MENLYEYLISKENKDRVHFKFKKENVTPGDIIAIRIKPHKDIRYLIFGKRSELSKFGPAPKYDGFIVSYGQSISGRYLRSFNDDMTSNDPTAETVAIYPGGFPPINSLYDLTEDFLKELIQNRTKIDI